jgi:hypothetical protein
MIVRNIVLTLLCMTMFVGMAGCSDNSGKFIITENRNVPACGIDDPLTKIEWLSEYCKKHTPTNFTSITITISVYVNKITLENHYVMSYINSEIVEYSSQEVYDCSGQKLFFKGIEGPTPTGWNDFFAANEPVATIWEIKKE